MIQPALSTNGSPPRTRSLFNRASDALGGVWLGIVLATLLFVYCAIGSAVPQVRQSPLLEMTEFQWFHWWPFNVLVVAFCVTLTLTTLQRIPFRFVNLGVWTIHTGVIVMVVGSYYYFGTKVEGDAPVFRRRVLIELPGMMRPQSLVVLPGSETRVAAGPDVWRFSIQSTNAQWPILSEPDQGKTAYAVNVAVTPPKGQPFVRQLLAGYEQYTEDVLPGQGRAVKAIGRKLVDEQLKLTLEYHPQEYFHVMDTWALHVRRSGETEWKQRVIHGLPRYHDRVASRDQVFADTGSLPALRALDLPVPPGDDRDALGEVTPRVTGYLRYAHLEQRWREGGEQLNPVIRVSMLSSAGDAQSHELIAFDRSRHTLENGLVQFVWLSGAEQVAQLPRDARAMLGVDIPDAGLAQQIPLTQDTVAGRDVPFTSLGESGFGYRLLGVQDHMVLPNRAAPVSIAMVEIQSPEGTFRRWVADDPALTRDLHGESADPHAVESKAPDPRVKMTYAPGSAPLIFAGYPGGVHVVFNGAQGRAVEKAVRVGEAVEIVPGLSARVDALWTHAVAEVKPAVVPLHRRERDARETFAMIRLELPTAQGLESRWVRFNSYALPDESYRYAGRFSYLPERFRLADGTAVEVLFSRERRRLPNPIALEEFELDTHVGGYTGSVSTIRNYVSNLRFLDGGQWTAPRTIAVNNPTEYGGYWYFQSMWDRPQRDNPAGGMNYTGLGVGNRHGVYIQLAGCCLTVAGMIFAFYVKPVLQRRRALESRARIAGLSDLMEEDASATQALVEVSG